MPRARSCAVSPSDPAYIISGLLQRIQRNWAQVVHPPLLTRTEAPTRTEVNQRTRATLLRYAARAIGVMRLLLASLLSAVMAAAAAAVPDTEAAELAAENSMLQLKLKRLEDELQQELKYLSVLTRTSRSLRTERMGYACQPPACCTYQRRRAAWPGEALLRAVRPTYRGPTGTRTSW